MVVATALLGMVTMMLTTLNERRREMAILRSVGARPRTILGLLMAEAGVLTVAGVLLGIVLLYAALLIAPALRRPASTVCIWRSIRRGSRVADARGDRARRLRGRAVAGVARLPAVARRWYDGQDMTRG